jgi:transposase InsO family protein
MPKRRAIILSVVLEGRSQADTARLYGVSRGWVCKLVARYRAEGDAAFAEQSRRPHTSPAKISEPTVELIIDLREQLTVQGLDAGPETIRWHLQTHHAVTVSVSTIRRHLVAAGLVKPEPKKRPKSSYIRFEAALPNETWQTDMTHWQLANNVEVELLSWLDDHSRYSLNITAHHRVNGQNVVEEFQRTAQTHGYPASVLSDNGMYYTARFARGGQSGPNRFETTLKQLGIIQKNSRPGHPTTCGKVERFQQTLKQWLTAQPTAHTLAELQHQLDTFRHTYNHDRPHRSLGRRTPATAYNQLPKTGPGQDPAGTHRIRHDRVDKAGKVTLRHNGKLHHIGIGRPHKHKRIILIINSLDIRVIHHQTGELLQHLTLDPTRNYQPQNKRNP